MPGFPAAVLVLVQAEAGLGGLEAFFDAPAAAGDGDQVVQETVALAASTPGQTLHV